MITDTAAPWQAAPENPARPGVSRRKRVREPALVALSGLVLSLVFYWPIVRDLRSTVLFDLGDPLLQAWELAWQRNFLLNGSDFWTANIFGGTENNFAFTDSLLGYLPFSLIGGDGPADAIVRYNLVFIFAATLAFVGGYMLVRQLGGTWHAAALGAVVFAWAPWRLAHAHHLNVLSTGGIALALFALARGHGFTLRQGFRPELAKPGWAMAGWLIAAWQVSIGFATGLPFIYVMGVIGVTIAVAMLRKRSQISRRLWIANGVGVVVFLTVTYLMTIPYRRVVDLYQFTRTWGELEQFSPPPQGLVTTSHFSWLWSDTAFTAWTWDMEPAPWEKWLFPGLVLLVFAVTGLAFSAWPRKVRLLLAIAVVVSSIFALGTSFFHGSFTYQLVWKFLPGWDALRTPGRLILWTTVFLLLLAAGAVTRMAQALARKQKQRVVALIMVLPALGALAEAVPVFPYAHPPAIPAGLQQEFDAREPLLVLPMDLTGDSIPMLWSTSGFPVLANGNSGNYPKPWIELSAATKAFPSSRSVEVLEQQGIRKVVVVKSMVGKTPYARSLTRSIDGLPLTRSESRDIVVFRLK